MSGAVAGRLHALEAVIERGLKTFVEVGEALGEIREGRLYREQGYDDFDSYCRERWGFGRDYADKQIQASNTVERLPTNVGVLPSSEGQARPLSRIKDPEVRAEVWGDVVEGAYGTRTPAPDQQPHAPITEAKVREKVQERLDLTDRSVPPPAKEQEPRRGAVVPPVPGVPASTPVHERRRVAAERKGQRLAQRAEYALRAGNTELPADLELAASWEYALWEAVWLRGRNIPNVVDALGHQLHILLRHAPPEVVGWYLAEPVNNDPDEAEYLARILKDLREGAIWLGRVLEEAERARGPGSESAPHRPVRIVPTEEHGGDYGGRVGLIVGTAFEAYGFGPGRKWRWKVRLDDGEQIEVLPWEVRFL